jgi:hypothetical protein
MDALDSILDSLEKLVEQAPDATKDKPAGPNPLEVFLSEPERTTNVKSIRNHPTVQEWRRELQDATTRNDVAYRALNFVDELLKIVLSARV